MKYELHDLELLIRARTPIIVIETHEEPRVTKLFQKLADTLSRPLYKWTIVDGLQRIDMLELSIQKTIQEPLDILKYIRGVKVDSLYLFMDFHPFMMDPVHIRLIKEIALQHDAIANTLVFVSHNIELPAEIKKYAAHFELSLPDQKKIREIIQLEALRWKQVSRQPVNTEDGALESLTNNLLGLPEQDAIRLARQAIVNDNALTQSDIPEVMAAKYRLLNQDSGIHYEYETANFSEVAGMRRLKTWLQHRQSAFLGKSEPTLDRPKGILLIGVQGAGKSLTAKAVAGVWDVPLLRLDLSGLYNKYIGETEKNLEDALRTAEIMSPCILWIDEIEKALAAGDDTTGTSQRLLGSILTWMAERKSAVFLTFTANDISSLPPELIRKGRLDEIFFVDLPGHEVREEIFRIHMHKRDIDPSDFDLDKLAVLSKGFSGAEIEQAIVSALYAARTTDSPLKQSGIIEELLRTKPLSQVMKEKIDYLRDWAADRTVPAD